MHDIPKQNRWTWKFSTSLQNDEFHLSNTRIQLLSYKYHQISNTFYEFNGWKIHVHPFGYKKHLALMISLRTGVTMWYAYFWPAQVVSIIYDLYDKGQVGQVMV